MLDVETQDHLFNIEMFRNPFNYQLKVTENNELVPTKVDLVENEFAMCRSSTSPSPTVLLVNEKELAPKISISLRGLLSNAKFKLET